MTDQRIGYLTSQYPAPSHTFIRREIAALRAAGTNIVTYSIQRAPSGLDAELDRAAAIETFTVLARPLMDYTKAHITGIVTRPGRYLRTLRLAYRHRVPGVRAALWSLFHFAEAILLAKRLEADGIGHLHNHFANSAATVGLLASRFAAIDWSLTLHGISEFDYPAGLLLRDKIEAAKFVACVSRFGMAQAMRLIPPSEWSKLSIVRCGIDLATLPPRPASRPIAAGPVQVIAVGRLSAEKGHVGLLEAIAMVRNRGIAVALTIVGDGPEAGSLEAQVKHLGLESIVHFPGRQDEQSALASIATADMLVLSSFMEGLPVVLMEAMALGVPVVATRVAGIPELVRDEVSGLLFDPADWAALADAIATLANDTALRGRLAVEGRLRIDQEFVIERAVARLPALFAGDPI